MSISFSEIPQDNLVPIFATEFDNSNASKSGAMPWKNLIIGQPLSSKTDAVGVLTKISSDEQADAMFGAGSQLALMVKNFRKNSKTSELWCLPVADDGDSAAATGEIAVTVASESGLPAAGVIRLMIAGQSCLVNVAATDVAASTEMVTGIDKKIAAAINAKENLPVTASAASGVVTLTAKNKGKNGEGIDIRYNHNQGEFLPEGLTLAVTAMANGGSDPSYEDAAIKSVCEGTWFNMIVCGSDEAENVTYIKEMLDERWTAIVQQTGVLVFSLGAKHDVSGKATGIADEEEFTARGGKLNSQVVVLVALPDSPTPGYAKASAVLGCVASKALNDPAMPLSNYAVAGIVAPKEDVREGFEGNNALLKSGCALMTAADDGTVYLKRCVTTYKTNANGAKDTSYQQLETVLTLSYLRWDWNNYLASKYPHAKLADDGDNFGAGQVVMTPELGKAELLSRYEFWMQKGLVQNYKDFAANLVVVRDPDDKCAMQFLIPAHLVSQFFTGKSKILFD